MVAANSRMAGACEIIKKIMGTASTPIMGTADTNNAVEHTKRKSPKRMFRGLLSVESQQCEGPKLALLTPWLVDDATVMSDDPKVLNGALCAAGAEMGPNHPHSSPPVDVMELTPTTNPESHAKDTYDCKDTPTGVKDSEEDPRKCPTIGCEVRQGCPKRPIRVRNTAEDPKSEQGTVVTCSNPEENSKTVQDMLASNGRPEEATQPAPPRSLNRLHNVLGFISTECQDLISRYWIRHAGARACGCTQVQQDDLQGVALPCQRTH